MTMNKTYTTILTIVTVLCILLGTLWHLGPFIFGSFKLPFPVNDILTGSGEYAGFEQSYADVTALSIDADLLQVNLDTHNGNDVLVSFDGSEKLKPSVDEKNGVLTITQKTKNAGLRNIDLKNAKSVLNVSLPENLRLDSFVADIDAGNMEIDELTAGEYIIKVDMGNVEGDEIRAEKADIDCNMGNVDLDSCDFKDLSVKTDMGNVEIDSEKDLSDHAFSCSTDMGNVIINGEKVSKNYTTPGNGGNVRIETNMGNVIIDYK